MENITAFLSGMESNFAEWREQMVQNEPAPVYFTRDGIMDNFRVGKVEATKRWFNSSFRPLVLLKDQHQHSQTKYDEDITDWFNLNPAISELSLKFFRNIANVLWGLCKSDTNGNDWWLPEINMHFNELKDFFRTQPFAFVECKKQPGGAGISDKEIQHHLTTYSKYIKEEISLLNPNYLICCGAKIFDFVCRMYDGDDFVGDGNIRFYQNSKTYVVYSGHPSVRCSLEDFYEGVMYHYRTFLKNYNSL